jgi:hypothetical protein
MDDEGMMSLTSNLLINHSEPTVRSIFYQIYNELTMML